MHMKIKWTESFLGLTVAAALVVSSGCGENQQPKDKTFFTSGNREADQRADQRMAQQQQLTGNTNNGGTTSTKSEAVLAEQKKPLYDQIGGSVGVNLIVDDFVGRALADPRVNLTRVGVKHGGFSIHHDESMEWSATHASITELKMYMVQFLSLATGGPVKYTGPDIHTATADMHFSNPQFDAALGDLKATLDKLQIANTQQKELLAVAETTREQVVEDR
jgi:hemoglobin